MLHEDYWPQPEVFLDLSGVIQMTDGRARCTGVAVCDEEGRPAQTFYQGQAAHFFYEFEVLSEIDDVPSGGLEFHDALGHVIHGKNTLQYGTPAPDMVHPGMRLRYHHTIHLEVSPGEYQFTVGLASTDRASYAAYCQGLIGHEQLGRSVRERCRVMNAGKFTVGFGWAGELMHHGTANLPGNCRVSLVEPSQEGSLPVTAPDNTDQIGPTIFHVTHWKAGSQWIHKILRECVSERIVPPQPGEVQFLCWPLQVGSVYPTVYVTKQQFDSVRLPANWRRFVVIRDLRDTLVSAYFSLKISHPILDSQSAQWRAVLQSLDLEAGMLYLMDEWLPGCARIQVSWLEAGERSIRYEDLLAHDLKILERVLLDECQLPVSHERFQEAVWANRFERLTQGRERGQENAVAHERKGIAGDWRNYFSERLKRAFKARYGGLLVATGYEKDLNW